MTNARQSTGCALRTQRQRRFFEDPSIFTKRNRTVIIGM
jgi:hypothetical protein